jgi:CHAD domain-containing protein
MPYQFESGESVPQAIRRIAAEQISGALESLSAQPAQRDEAVHDVRKRVKKLRALLRLIETGLGASFDSENARLRDIGQHLCHFRDAAAMIQTFDTLREKYAKDWPAGGLETVRGGLLAHKTRGERQQNIKAALQAAARELRAAKSRMKHWPLHEDGFPAIAPGIERAFRRGRAAMAKAHHHPTPETFHAWRKRVKDHWYHVRLLNHLWPDVMNGYEQSLKRLEDTLGMDHNLNVLADRVKAEPGFFGAPGQIEALLKSLAHFQKELRQEALSIGLRVYADKPRAFVRRLARWWAEMEQADGRGSPLTIKP